MGTMEINALSQQSIGEPGISSLIFKGTSTTTDRDAGFCSGGDEDDLEIEDDLHSPTDTSEDSVEVKVTPILSRNKNKRKCAEPRKVSNDEMVTAPLKKRIRFELKKENGRHSPFRPWNAAEKSTTSDVLSMPPSSSNVHPVIEHHLPSLVQQNEPLSLVKTIVTRQRRQSRSPDCSTKSVPDMIIRPKEFAKLPIKLESQIPRVPHHPDVRDLTTSEIDELSEMSETSPKFNVESLLSLTNPSSSQSSQCLKEQHEQKEHRNYKNMTRERRIEANARERTRVHTISAAFDTLRKAIPAYSHNQKLSKLSVLRIACSYILTLSRVAENDYSADQSAPSLASCVDLVSRTIQTEGKLRKKKDE